MYMEVQQPFEVELFKNDEKAHALIPMMNHQFR